MGFTSVVVALFGTMLLYAVYSFIYSTRRLKTFGGIIQAIIRSNFDYNLDEVRAGRADPNYVAKFRHIDVDASFDNYANSHKNDWDFKKMVVIYFDEKPTSEE